jgi:hypothetical protein
MTILDLIGFIGGNTAVGGYANTGLEAISAGLDNINKKIKNEGLNKFFGELSSGITPLGAVSYWDKIIKSSKDMNQSLGIAGNYSAILEKNTLDAYTNSANLGVEIDDITKSYGELITAYGRTIGLTTSDLSKLGEFHVLFQDSYAEVGNYFNQLAIGGADYVDHLETAMKNSLRIGVVSKKTLDTLRSNIGLVDRFSFSRGTRALSEMALFAERTRISMESAAKASDMFRSLDTGVESLAKLQMLGGKFAQEFGNIFEITFEARNNPEAIQKRLFKVTSELARMNKLTGEIEIDPYQLDRATAAAAALNIDVQELVQAARVSLKERSIQNLFNIDIRTKKDFEEISQMVAGMAEFKDGQWSIRLGNEIKTIAEIDEKDLKTIELYNKNEADIMRDVIMSNKTLTDSLTILTNVMMRNIIPKNFYEHLDDNLKKIFQESDKALLESSFMNSLKVGLEAMHGSVKERNIFNELSLDKGMGDTLKDMLGQAGSNIIDIPEQYDLLMSELTKSADKQSDILGNMGLDNSVLIDIKDNALTFFKTGTAFYDYAGDMLYNFNPFDWSKTVDELTDFIKYPFTSFSSKSGDTNQTFQNMKTKTEEIINNMTSSGLIKVDTNNNGKIEFGEIKGMIVLENKDGTKLSEIQVDELAKYIQPIIAKKMSDNVKIEVQKEKRSDTLRSGGGRTRDSKMSGLGN